MFERFVRESRRAVTCAQDEARALGAERVEPEHLLLALAGGCGDPAACAIGEAGLSREAIAGAIEQDLVATLEVVGVPASVVASVPARPGADRPRLNLAARDALERSLREALRRGDRRIGTEHLLLGACAHRPQRWRACSPGSGSSLSGSPRSSNSRSLPPTAAAPDSRHARRGVAPCSMTLPVAPTSSSSAERGHRPHRAVARGLPDALLRTRPRQAARSRAQRRREVAGRPAGADVLRRRGDRAGAVRLVADRPPVGPARVLRVRR